MSQTSDCRREKARRKARSLRSPKGSPILHRTFEYRLYPSKAQEKRLLAMLEACRFVYNWAVEDRKNLWDYVKVTTSFYDQSAYLKHLKDDHPFLKDEATSPMQEALQRVNHAFQDFFRRCKTGEEPGYPRFKGRHQYNSFAFRAWGLGTGCRVDGRRLRLPKIGRVAVRWDRPLEGKPKRVVIKRQADGWYAFIFVEMEVPEPKPASEPVGIDMGLKSFATLSNGEKVENPRHMKAARRDFAQAKRRVNRRKKGSARRRKAGNILARKSLKVERARTDFHRKTAKALVDRFNPIVVEDLEIKPMARKRKDTSHAVRRSIYDAGWGMFLKRLSCKAESAGTRVIRVEPRGTSQVCSECGVDVPKDLSVRVHACPDCGYVADRDINAARNILSIGLGRSLQGGAHPCPDDLRSRGATASAERQIVGHMSGSGKHGT